MNEILRMAHQELTGLSKENGLKTSTIRKLSSKLYHSLQNKEINYVLSICEEFLKEHTWAMGVIAFDWAYRVKKQYTDDTYHIFYRWLEKYVRGWGDCDDFCTHAFGNLLMQKKEIFHKIVSWTVHPDFWVRRASAVILIPLILHGNYEGIDPLVISDSLMMDEHDLVRKGYGWMLKSLSTKEPLRVYHYLLNNKGRIPRVAYRYALEKMTDELKAELMK